MGFYVRGPRGRQKENATAVSRGIHVVESKLKYV
jgi:hypothetical protein